MLINIICFQLLSASDIKLQVHFTSITWDSPHTKKMKLKAYHGRRLFKTLKWKSGGEGDNMADFGSLQVSVADVISTLKSGETYVMSYF